MRQTHPKLPARPRSNPASSISERALVRTHYGVVTIAAFCFVAALILGLVH